MKGFIDLVFCKDQRYYFIDWKSNDLGEDPSAYSKENMEEVMHTHHYFLQAALYAAALERYVKLFDNRPFSESFGGAIYVFLRGKAFYHFVPNPLDDHVIEEYFYESIR
jgi:exodeoxyribonuclease V beta subunit